MNTLVRSNGNNQIVKTVQQHQCLFSSFDRVYLFGSSLEKDRVPNDVDILLVYSTDSKNTMNNIDDISRVLEKELYLPIHLTILSSNELVETGFLRKIAKYQRIL